MIINEERQNVIVGGAQSVEAFTIKASAKAFQILSANLYSNPLGSMIRELSTNAYDAHIMVDKKDTPFEIKLPNSMDPSFKIRDFGPGLSEEDIMQVYTTFFESTKTNSNDMVGCLGLGSKSPFGVADSFTINSYHNNVKTIYSAFLNDMRIPTIAKFFSCPSDEPSGLEIEVAIKEKDFNVFAREVNTQLKYFTTKPTVTGDSNFKWNPTETYLYEGSSWKMIVINGPHIYKEPIGPRVIQGQIAYPVSIRAMGATYDNAPNTVKELLNRNIIFTVDIGAVNIAPSREALTYDDKTCQNIITQVAKAVEEIPTQINLAIQNADSVWNAKLLYNEIMRSLNTGYSYNTLSQHISAANITYKGVDVSSMETIISVDDIISMVSYDKNHTGKFIKHNYVSQHNYVNKYPQKFCRLVCSDLEKTLIILANSSDKAVDARAKQHCINKYPHIRNVVIITSNNTLEDIAEKIGTDKIVLATSLPKITRVVKPKPKEKTISLQQFNYVKWNKVNLWNTVTVSDLSKLTGCYVNLDRFDVIDPDTGTMYNDFKDTFNAAVELGLITHSINIYGFRAQNQKRTHTLPTFFEMLKNNVSNISKNAYNFGNSSVAKKIVEDSEQLRVLLNNVDKTSPMHELAKLVLDARVNGVSYRCQKLIDKIKLVLPIINAVELSTKCDELYPMISHSGYYLKGTDMATYVAQVDALMELKGMLPKVCEIV